MEEICEHKAISLYGTSHWHCWHCPARGDFPVRLTEEDMPKETLLAKIKWGFKIFIGIK